MSARWLAGVLSALSSLACDAPSPIPLPGSGGPAPALDRPDDEEVAPGDACPLGATRACSVEHAAGCAEGTQYCPDGAWTECRRDVARSPHRRALSDAPSTCGEDGTTPNACDAECRAFAPPPPDFGAGIRPIEWETGTLGSLPAAALEAALPVPCAADADCQIDHHCPEGPAPRTCAPYEPFETSPSCPEGFDVTAAVACVGASGGTVPVCNRGGQAIPAATLSSFVIRHAEAPPHAMDGCSLSGAGVAACPVVAEEDLAPGECVNVACDAIAPGSRVYVDVGGAPDCECGNNWTFNVDGACGEPSCGASVATAQEIPVTILLAMDVSGSMDSGSPTRLDAVRAAMRSFVEDPSSGGVGVALKVWPEGRCERPTTGGAGACDADGPYLDGAACGAHPCETSATALDAACSPEVAAVCATSRFERCCGDFPQAGACATPPCAPSDAPQVKGCVAEVTATCNTSGLERCCGGWPGTCAQDPCSAHAGALSSCNTSSNAAIQDVCNDPGFERCCGGSLPTSGAFTVTLAPCAAAPGSAMMCRNNGGAARACSSLNIPNNQATSLAARMKAFLATPAGSSCASSWTAGCVSGFRAWWGANVGGDPCGPAAWDAACVSRWQTKVPAGSCEKGWDEACVADYAARVAGSSTKKCSQPKAWDAGCVAKLDELSSGACTACDHPSIPRGASSIEDHRLELSADARTSEGGTDTAEELLVEAIEGLEASGNTPTHAALAGVIDFCRDYQAAHPEERAVVVFATDGEPYGCNPSGSTSATASDKAAIRQLAAQGREDGVFTYAVGIEGSSTTFMHQIAQSGGTSAAFLLGSGSQATEDLKAALVAIRNQFACSYVLPDDATLDQIDVRWNDGVTNPTIARVSDVAECGAVPLGYFPAGAAEISLCPATCEAIRARAGTNVEIIVGCGGEAVSMTIVEELSAGDACADLQGTFPRWTSLLYDANVPEGSTIRVHARTRVDAGAEWGALVPITVIDHTNENALPDAPISLAAAFGAAAFARDVEVTFTSTVEGGAPALLSYELAFTCAPSE